MNNILAISIALPGTLTAVTDTRDMHTAIGAQHRMSEPTRVNTVSVVFQSGQEVPSL